MDTDLHKRIKEAANAYIHKHLCDINCLEAYIAGAEYGYKEAIAKTKEWLKTAISNYTSEYIVGCSKGEFISAFENDMNKLWEEEK